MLSKGGQRKVSVWRDRQVLMWDEGRCFQPLASMNFFGWFGHIFIIVISSLCGGNVDNRGQD